MPNTRALKMSKRNKFTFILKIKKTKCLIMYSIMVQVVQSRHQLIEYTG